MRINYNALLREKPWIVSNNQQCIISPDTDGFLCALLMTNYFKWQVQGFYDGKTLLVGDKIDPKDAIFLDMEIFSNGIRSIGQHMLLPNKNELPVNWSNFSSCISPNNLRRVDAHSDFAQKYPFGTIHFLLSIISNKVQPKYDEKILAPLLFADGTFKNIFNYPENSISWLKYLDIGKVNVLNEMFYERENNLSALMGVMESFFAKIRTIGGASQGTEKLKLTEIEASRNNLFCIKKEERKKTIEILKMLSAQTGWKFIDKNWMWGEFKKYDFEKKILENTTSYKKRNSLLEQRVPLSYAITARNRIEYTLLTDVEMSIFNMGN